MCASHPPGIELVMEAFEGYWRKVPAVKRLVFKRVPAPSTRAAMVKNGQVAVGDHTSAPPGPTTPAAMLKNGEVDVAYMLDTPTAQELKRDPALRLGFSGAIGVHY